MKILLFVSSHCPHCPRAEAVVKKVAPEYHKHGVELEKIRLKTSNGKHLSEELGVLSTPTTLILNDKGIEIRRIVGVPSESEMRNKIEGELGLKRSFLERVFGSK